MGAISPVWFLPREYKVSGALRTMKLLSRKLELALSAELGGRFPRGAAGVFPTAPGLRWPSSPVPAWGRPPSSFYGRWEVVMVLVPTHAQPAPAPLVQQPAPPTTSLAAHLAV